MKKIVLLKWTYPFEGPNHELLHNLYILKKKKIQGGAMTTCDLDIKGRLVKDF